MLRGMKDTVTTPMGTGINPNVLRRLKTGPGVLLFSYFQLFTTDQDGAGRGGNV
jgi:hypothetical protein